MAIVRGLWLRPGADSSRLPAWLEALPHEGRAAAEVLRAEFQPISDMRASAAYRTEVLGNLLQRLWLESQGVAGINLESWAGLGALA